MIDRLSDFSNSSGNNPGRKPLSLSSLKTYGSRKNHQTRFRSTPYFPVSSPRCEKEGNGHGLSNSLNTLSSSPIKQKQRDSHKTFSWESSDEENTPTKRFALDSSPPKASSKRAYESSSDESRDDNYDDNISPKPRRSLSSSMPSILSNIKRRRKVESNSTSTVPKLVQTRLALSDNLKTTCRDCGMSYMPTYSMDVKLHSKFHSQSFEGRDWAPEWGSPVSFCKANVSESPMDGYYIVKITPSSKPAEKRAAQDLITLVNTELSAPSENPTWKSGPAGAGAAYVYVCSKKRKAIGILVVERISRGRPMLASTSELLQVAPSSNNTSKSKPERFPVIMGVARIFTVKNYRRKKVGSTLLNAACSDFIYGLKILKTQVAWSQPSRSGAKLALAWSPYSYPSKLVESSLLSPPPSSPPSSPPRSDTHNNDLTKKSLQPSLAILTYLESDAVVKAGVSS